MTYVGEKIRNARKELGLSQRTLGEMVGVDRSYISQIENGTRKWPESVVQQLTRALEMEEGTLEIERMRDLYPDHQFTQGEGGANQMVFRYETQHPPSKMPVGTDVPERFRSPSVLAHIHLFEELVRRGGPLPYAREEDNEQFLSDLRRAIGLLAEQTGPYTISHATESGRFSTTITLQDADEDESHS